jgi:tryptophan-rich sensory protein
MPITPIKSSSTPRAAALLLLFIAVVVGVGVLIGFTNLPGAWYAGLAKPWFNPPNWLFGPVWTMLYVLIAIAGWRTFRRDPIGMTMRLWIGQLLLNWAWSPVSFTMHALWPAFAILVVLWLAIAAFIAGSWRADRTAAWLFVPYLAWVSFAGLLNVSLAILN